MKRAMIVAVVLAVILGWLGMHPADIVATGVLRTDVCSDAYDEGTWALAGYQTNYDLYNQDVTNYQLQLQYPGYTDYTNAQLQGFITNDQNAMTYFNGIMDADRSIIRANQCPKMF